MIKLTYEDEMLITQACSGGTRESVIAALEKRRGSLRQDENVLSEMYDHVLEQLGKMDNEEFDSLKLFVFDSEKILAEAASSATELLRCPHCGAVLLFVQLNSKYYYISDDGAYLIRDSSKRGQDKTQEFLTCIGCLHEYRPIRDNERRITDLEVQKIWA